MGGKNCNREISDESFPMQHRCNSVEAWNVVYALVFSLRNHCIVLPDLVQRVQSAAPLWEMTNWAFWQWWMCWAQAWQCMGRLHGIEADWGARKWNNFIQLLLTLVALMVVHMRWYPDFLAGQLPQGVEMRIKEQLYSKITVPLWQKCPTGCRSRGKHQFSWLCFSASLVWSRSFCLIYKCWAVCNRWAYLKANVFVSVGVKMALYDVLQ